MIANVFAGNYDWPDQNWYAGRRREPGAGWMFFSWDGELTLDNVNGNRVNASAYDSPAAVYDNLRRENEEFRVLFGDHVHRHFFNGGALTPNANVERWMARAAQIDRAVVAESARWGDRARPIPYTRDNEWIVEQRRLVLAYFPARTRIVLEQFRDNDLYPTVAAPVFSQHGGDFFPGLELDIAAPDGIVYYTDDGSDPRLPGGGISPSAQVVSGPLTLTDNVTLRARARSGIEWSSLNEADFTAAVPLRVTELMYNPALGDGYEFLEIRNIGPSAINLAGVTLSDGITFTFPSMLVAAGGHALVVESMTAFTSHYGSGLPVAGQYTGRLSNGGERLVLSDAGGGVIQDFEFDDAWYPSTDGGGRSLVIRDALGAKSAWNEAGGWRASAAADGTAGAVEPARCDNGLDDDGDGLVDLADPGCGDAGHDREDPACNDGVDNDGDGAIDAVDVHCTSAASEAETPDAGDSFLCYRTRANEAAPDFDTATVSTSDEFESDVDVAVRTPRVLCLAGALNDAGVIDNATHLQGYEIREIPSETLHTPQTRAALRRRSRADLPRHAQTRPAAHPRRGRPGRSDDRAERVLARRRSLQVLSDGDPDDAAALLPLQGHGPFPRRARGSRVHAKGAQTSLRTGFRGRQLHQDARPTPTVLPRSPRQVRE